MENLGLPSFLRISGQASLLQPLQEVVTPLLMIPNIQKHPLDSQEWIVKVNIGDDDFPTQGRSKTSKKNIQKKPRGVLLFQTCLVAYLVAAISAQKNVEANIRDLGGVWRFRRKSWCFNRTSKVACLRVFAQVPRLALLQPTPPLPHPPPCGYCRAPFISQPSNQPAFFCGKNHWVVFGRQETSRDLLMLFFFQGPGNGHFWLQGHETIEDGLPQKESNPATLNRWTGWSRPGIYNNLGMFSDVTLRFSVVPSISSVVRL